MDQGLSVPIFLAALNNAERIYPDKLEAQIGSDLYSMPKVEGQCSKRDIQQVRAVVIQLQFTVSNLPPAMTESGVLKRFFIRRRKMERKAQALGMPSDSYQSRRYVRFASS